MTSLLLLLLAQTTTPVQLVKVNPDGGPVVAVNCVSGCSASSSGSSTTTLDGGYSRADQGVAAATAGAWPMKVTDGTDTADVTAASALKVDNSAVTQPISAAALPLPTGAATSSLQGGGLPAALDGSGYLKTHEQGTAAISAASLPLPSGAATASNQTTVGSSTTKINDGTDTLLISAAGAALVDASATTQPISAAALPLPSGAATSAAQTDKSQFTKITDGTDTLLVSTAGSAAVDLAQVAGASVVTGNGTAAGAIRVALPTDGTGVVVLGTGSAQIGHLEGNQSTNVAQLAGTATDTNSGSKSGGTLRVVIATDQPALSNKLLVTPDSVALPANQSVNMAQVGGTNTVTGGVAGILAVGGNVANAGTATANPVPVGGVFTTSPTTLTTGQTATAQFTAAQNLKQDLSTLAGTATDTNSGTKSGGTLRVVIATDQPALTNKLLVTPDSVALPANQSVNLSQVGGGTTATGNGTAAGSLRVALPTDGTGVVGLNSGTNTIGSVKLTDGTTVPGVIAATTALKTDLASIAGTATPTGNGTAATSLRVSVASDSTGSLAATQATASNLNAQVVGTVAHDGTAAGNPLLIGAYAETVEDSDANTNGNRVSADSDVTRLLADRGGVLFTRLGPAHQWSYHENSSSALTDTTVHASCGTGLYNYITSITASTGAATAFNLFIEDSTTTTILGPYYLEAVNGRGFTIPLVYPKKQTNSATLVSVTTSAAIAHSIDITGFCAP